MRTQCILLTAVLCLLLLQPDLTYSTYSQAAPDYVLEDKAQCHYMNGTQKVRFLERLFYNREEFVYFDSDVGYYIAKTELGRAAADHWNKDPVVIERRKREVERSCVYNYGIFHSSTADRRVKPTIKISLMPHHEEERTEHHMLACNVYGFYPSAIDVKWYRNGLEVTAQAQSTELFQNGDWTFQILVILETEIQKGDKFTCVVHHKSLEKPETVEWPTDVRFCKKQVGNWDRWICTGNYSNHCRGVCIYERPERFHTYITWRSALTTLLMLTSALQTLMPII